MNTTDTDRRQAVIDGLRALADFLATHPDVPVSFWQHIAYCVRGADDVEGVATVEAVARALGVVVTDTGNAPVTPATTHFQARRDFGPVSYEAIYIRRQTMADHEALMSYSGTVRAGAA